MPVTGEIQVRAACALNGRIPTPPVPQSVSSDHLQSLLEGIRSTADLPLAFSRTLPAEAYTSPAFYDWEEKHLFRAEWQCVAHTSQIAEVGDFVTIDLL